MGWLLKQSYASVKQNCVLSFFFQFCQRQNLKLFTARAVKKEFSDRDGFERL